MKHVKIKILKQLIIFEGFSQNGHHHWIQRIFLHIVAPVKIYFRHFFENDFVWILETLKTILDDLKAWDYAKTICNSEKLQIAYIEAEKIPGNIFFDISKVQKSSRRGVFDGIFHKLRIQGRMQILKKGPRVL